MLERLSSTRMLLLMLLGGFAFDFRRVDNTTTSYIQFVFLAIALLGGILLCSNRLFVSDGRISVLPGKGRFIFLAIMAFLFWAPIAVIAGTSPSHSDFVSTFLPYALTGLTMLAVVLVVGDGLEPIAIVRTLIIVACISSIWRVIYGFVANDASIESIRWQILSPALPVLLGASVATLLTSKRLVLPLAGLALFLGIVMLSVTRAYLISLILVMACTVALAIKGGLPEGSLKRITKPALLFFGAVFLCLVLASAAGVDAAKRWTSRLVSQKNDEGIDITLITRLAEYKGQYDSLTVSPFTMLIGKGFGSSYEWDEGYLTDFLSFVVEEEESKTTKGSHSTWLFPYYTQGVIFGTAFIIALVLCLPLALYRCCISTVKQQEHYAMLFVFLSLGSFFGISVTANIINERLGGIIIGALVGLSIARKRSPIASAQGASIQLSSSSVAHI